MLENYIPIVLMLGVAAAFGIVMGKINEFLGPRKPSEEKLSTYESGMEPVRSARERFSVKFYMVATLFILFDVEVVFMYPWAVVLRDIGSVGLVAMATFIAVLLVGYIFIWKKGALEWD